MTRRRKIKTPSPTDAKVAVMTGAAVLCSVFEWLEGMEAGASPVASAKRALHRGKKRRKMVARVERALPDRAPEDDEEDDAT